MVMNALPTSPPRPAVPDHLIVARDQASVVQALRKAVAAGRNVTILVDRRHAERRRRVQPVLEEQRRGDRRNLLALTADPRPWPYVLVRERDR